MRRKISVFVEDQELGTEIPGKVAFELSDGLAAARVLTASMALLNSTECPHTHARSPRAVARCDFPNPRSAGRLRRRACRAANTRAPPAPSPRRSTTGAIDACCDVRPLDARALSIGGGTSCGILYRLTVFVKRGHPTRSTHRWEGGPLHRLR